MCLIVFMRYYSRFYSENIAIWHSSIQGVIVARYISVLNIEH